MMSVVHPIVFALCHLNIKHCSKRIVIASPWQSIDISIAASIVI